jgi:hypothetical protein
VSKGDLLGVLSKTGKSASPLVEDTLRKMERDQVQELLDGTTALVLRRDAPGVLRLLSDTVNPLLQRIQSVEGIPLPHLEWALPRVHVQDLPGLANLRGPELSAALAAYADALAGGGIDALRQKLPPALWAEYLDAARERVAFTVFTTDFSGFRMANLESAMVRDLLDQGYKAYLLRKQRQGAAARLALDWAYQQTERSRYYALLLAEFGPDFKTFLKPLVDRIRYEVTAAAAESFKSLVNTQGTYEGLREALRGLGPYGHLFEVDHILEKRFLHTFNAPIDQGDFPSFLVPKNVAVSKNLAKKNVRSFLYVHTTKTVRMRTLFPYGTEGYFDLQEIYDGYRLVYIHEFGLGDTFAPNLDNVFAEMARLAPERLPRGQRVLDMTAISEAELLTRVVRARARVRALTGKP